MDWKTIIWVPLISSTVMGAVAFITYRLLKVAFDIITGEFVSNAFATLLSIGIAAVIYFISMIKVGGYTEDTLLAFPKGAILVKFARKLHLIQ